MNNKVTTVSIKDLFKSLNAKTFPRKLIIMKDKVSASIDLVTSCVEILNDLVYQNRLAEFDITGGGDNGTNVGIVDCTTLSIVGIEVKTVTRVMPYPSYQNFFSMYEKVFYNQPAILNAVRRQDDFINFLMSKEVYNQIDRKFNSKDIDMFFTGDKLFLGESFRNVPRVVIEYLPYFKIAPSSETVYTDNNTVSGVLKFEKSIPNFPIKNQSMTIELANGVRLTDPKGTGDFTPSGAITAKLNYCTGELIVMFGQVKYSGQINLTYTDQVYQWQFLDKEYKFVKNMVEGLALIREGRAQNELKVMDMETNASDLQDEGKALLEAEIANFKGMRIVKGGKKF
jgi:hypothetical protein